MSANHLDLNRFSLLCVFVNKVLLGRVHIPLFTCHVSVSALQWQSGVIDNRHHVVPIFEFSRERSVYREIYSKELAVQLWRLGRAKDPETFDLRV